MRRTPRKAAQNDDATPADRADAFIAAIGHRLREPLNALAGALPQLRSTVDAARDRAISVVDRSLADQSAIVCETEWLLKAMAVGREAAAKAEVRGDAMTRARLPRLLIIDDSADAVEMWAFFFRSSAYDVLTATTGRQGLSAARRGAPDVILLDLQLPDLSGLEVARRLRCDARTVNIPLVAVTGYSSSKDHEAARKAGFSFVVVKPCNPDDLLRKVEGIVATPRQKPA